jgi:hypothetical protein
VELFGVVAARQQARAPVRRERVAQLAEGFKPGAEDDEVECVHVTSLARVSMTG